MVARDVSALLLASALRVASGFDFRAAADSLRLSDAIDVQEGAVRFLRREDCRQLSGKRPSALSDGALGLCSGVGGAALHGLVMLPRGRGETEGEEEKEGGRCPLVCDEERGLSAAWRLSASEALLLLGLTPPECADFGVAGYLYSRRHPEGWTPETVSAEESASCPAGPSRCRLFASVAEPWSARRLDPDRRALAPFALVVAASHAASQAAVAALSGVGVPSDSVHELRLPGRELTLGLGAGADVLTSLLRVVSASDKEALARYLEEKPLRVLRLSMKEPAKDQQLDLFARALPAAAAGPHGLAHAGAPRAAMSLPEAGRELAALQHAVIADAGRELGFDYRIRVTELSPRAPESGFECIARGLLCRADWPGSAHLASHALAASERECARLEESLRLRGSCRAVQRARLPPEDTDFMVVLGVNHRALGLAADTSLTVYNLHTMEALKVIPEAELRGSAVPYADPKRAQSAEYLYALKFMRRCPTTGRGARSCFTVPSEGPLGVPLDAPLHFAERTHGLPSGATSELLAPPRVVHFAAASGNPSQRKAVGSGVVAKAGGEKDGDDKQEM